MKLTGLFYWFCLYSLTHSLYADFRFDGASFSEHRSIKSLPTDHFCGVLQKTDNLF